MVDRLDALRAAAQRFIPPDRADEIARNLAGVDPLDLTYDDIVQSIERRRQHFGLTIQDPHPLARALWRAAQC